MVLKLCADLVLFSIFQAYALAAKNIQGTPWKKELGFTDEAYDEHDLGNFAGSNDFLEYIVKLALRILAAITISQSALVVFPETLRRQLDDILSDNDQTRWEEIVARLLMPIEPQDVGQQDVGQQGSLEKKYLERFTPLLL